MEAACIDYKDTGYFSQTVINYLDDVPELRSFYSYRPSMQGFAGFFNTKKVIANRQLLADVLLEQYFSKNEAYPQLTAANVVKAQIELLRQDDTYTVTTGHQLNIFTGPLYFIYKIVTAIKLCRQLKASFPDKNFIPVYWMASEDHDFAEINYTNIGGKKVHWWYEATGATGRINPDTMRQAINQYKGVLGIDGHSSELGEIVETAYTKFDRLADATRYLVNAIFGHYGLLIIDADDRRLKQQFAPIIEQDIIEQNSFRNISAANGQLEKLGVHVQVNPREINFFYLKEKLRERIVYEDDLYKVMNTDISFTAAELKEEIKNTPERFSPNVVMRPLYQECILPNIAYIGGGAEIVYWLQLKSNFDFYTVDFPILILRNSGLIIRKETADKINSMDLSPALLFKSTDEIKNAWVKQHSNHDLTLTEEWREFERTFEKIKLRSHKIDSTLPPSAAAIQARLKHALDNFQKKLVKAEKRNYNTRLEQIEHIKTDLFPNNSLQERTENFGLSYVKWGGLFIDELIRNFQPLDFKFTVLTE
ncbi:bacillithiol biosynthesis cysteine-adding enzyme BshC [Mucilaginibacter litoreus]|uniref:Putative cysteine ligase BshC n=1 Tax=Mucilaginibacter litoreus TaxID=1048221 RepID=A0ABW3AR03_9SPHI